MTGDWNPFSIKEDLFRVARGEAQFQVPHSYPILEMLNTAKFAFDKHRHQIPDGLVLTFEDWLAQSRERAALIEVHFQAELRLLDRLLATHCILSEDYERHLIDIGAHYEINRIQAAANAGHWLAVIESAIKPRRRGRPPNRLLPSKADAVDWQVILMADAIASPKSNACPPVQQCIRAILTAVKLACELGVLVPNTHPEVVAAGKQYEAHRKRISDKALKWLGD
ncbi:MAG: hypothetical protein O9306_07935 [Beijerinckiaceae bacterium]|nr:hypothetical protein [Beijerinckiaceae bacterium]